MEQSLIIIPTYDEKENIAELIAEIFSILPQVHLLFVDDSSPDGTAKLIGAFMEKYPEQIHLEIREKKEGLGKAYVHGFRWAIARDYAYVFEMDADLSHPAAALPLMLTGLQKGAGVVIGSRYLEGVNVVNWPLLRIALSMIASIYVRIILGLPVKDTTAGFVGYSRAALQSLNLEKLVFVGYAFQIEMKYKLWKNGFSLQEFPIIFTNRKKGKSKMDKTIIWEAMYGVFYLRLKSIFKRL